MSDNFMKDPRADTFAGWIAALTIFAKYHPEGLQGACSTGADHDVVYLPESPTPLASDDEPEEDEHGDPILVWPETEKADVDALIALGFHYDTQAECWACFV